MPGSRGWSQMDLMLGINKFLGYASFQATPASTMPSLRICQAIQAKKVASPGGAL